MLWPSFLSPSLLLWLFSVSRLDSCFSRCCVICICLLLSIPVALLGLLILIQLAVALSFTAFYCISCVSLVITFMSVISCKSLLVSSNCVDLIGKHFVTRESTVSFLFVLLSMSDTNAFLPKGTQHCPDGVIFKTWSSPNIVTVSF